MHLLAKINPSAAACSSQGRTTAEGSGMLGWQAACRKAGFTCESPLQSADSTCLQADQISGGPTGTAAAGGAAPAAGKPGGDGQG